MKKEYWWVLIAVALLLLLLVYLRPSSFEKQMGSYPLEGRGSAPAESPGPPAGTPGRSAR